MADELILQREGNHLVAPTQDWADLLAEFPPNVDLKVRITRARSNKQLGTYWGLLDWVIKFGPEWIGQRWLSKYELSDALQIKVGFTRPIASPLSRDVWVDVPKSKNFTECRQAAFNTYFNKVQDVLTEWCKYIPLDLYLNWMADRQRGAA
jgi:hypothetical protein